MTSRTRTTSVVFSSPFTLKEVGRTLPAGEYRVQTDEDLIEELSFPVYRRTSTVMFVPGEFHIASIQMVTIDPRGLEDALERDAAMPSTAGQAHASKPKP